MKVSHVAPPPVPPGAGGMSGTICRGINSGLVSGIQKGLSYGISLGFGALGASIAGAVGTAADPLGGEGAAIPGWDLGMTVGGAVGQSFSNWAIPNGTQIIPCGNG